MKDQQKIDIDKIKDWNELIPIVREAFLMMNGEERWYFHYDELMKALLGCDFLETKRHCQIFLLDHQGDKDQ